MLVHFHLCWCFHFTGCNYLCSCISVCVGVFTSLAVIICARAFLSLLVFSLHWLQLSVLVHFHLCWCFHFTGCNYLCSCISICVGVFTSLAAIICARAFPSVLVFLRAYQWAALLVLKLLNPCILINLFSFTKPTKCTYNIHNTVVFYHSNMFRQYCAVFWEILHQAVKLVLSKSALSIFRVGLLF